MVCVLVTIAHASTRSIVLCCHSQVIYNPPAYGQYVGPDHRIWTVRNRTTLRRAERDPSILDFNRRNASGLIMAEGDFVMGSLYKGYPRLATYTAIIPAIAGVLTTITLVALHRRKRRRRGVASNHSSPNGGHSRTVSLSDVEAAERNPPPMLELTEPAVRLTSEGSEGVRPPKVITSSRSQRVSRPGSAGGGDGDDIEAQPFAAIENPIRRNSSSPAAVAAGRTSAGQATSGYNPATHSPRPPSSPMDTRLEHEGKLPRILQPGAPTRLMLPRSRGSTPPPLTNSAAEAASPSQIAAPEARSAGQQQNMNVSSIRTEELPVDEMGSSRMSPVGSASP